jgi:hypothetical protein
MIIGVAVALGATISLASLAVAAVLKLNGVVLSAGPVQVNAVQVSANQALTVNGA